MSGPRGLPPVDVSLQADEIPAIDRARFCTDCGKEARLVSNNEGVEAYCGPCRKHWPISCTPMAPMMLPSAPRGLSKQTLVEPDWNRANEDPRGDPLNEQIGPKGR